MATKRGGGGGIDYSKWDHMDYGSCSSDDDNDSSPAGPRVTRLDGPSRVTRQSDGTVTIEPSTAEAATTGSITTTNAVAASTVVPPPTKKKKEESETLSSQPRQDQEVTPPPDWTRNGATEELSNGTTLYWSQDRQDVIFRIKLQHGVMGKDMNVEVQGALTYEDRWSAVGTQQLPEINVTCQQKVIVNDSLPHHIYLAQDEDDQVDWLVQQHRGIRYLFITLHKAVPMEGVVCWWRRALQGLPERNIQNDDHNSKQAQFQKAWEEAHKQFKDKIQAKKQQGDSREIVE